MNVPGETYKSARANADLIKNKINAPETIINLLDFFFLTAKIDTIATPSAIIVTIQAISGLTTITASIGGLKKSHGAANTTLGINESAPNKINFFKQNHLNCSINVKTNIKNQQKSTLALLDVKQQLHITVNGNEVQKGLHLGWVKLKRKDNIPMNFCL